MTDEVRVEAPAKVNLCLRVLGRRDDGFHDLESLLVPVSLSDVVVVRRADRLQLEVSGAAGLVSELPVDDRNLAFRAAVALAQSCDSAGGAAIHLEKRIPVAAGLGGGSADGAATLLALDELWGCGLGRDGVAGAAAHLGSDVPALVAGGAVVMRGRGELVERVSVPPLHLVLLPLEIGVSSGGAYAWWDEDLGPTGPPIDKVLRAVTTGDPRDLAAVMFDDLEPPVIRRHLQVEQAKARLLDAGSIGALMSGSGPTVFGLARDAGHATDVAARLGPPATAVVTLG